MAISKCTRYVLKCDMKRGGFLKRRTPLRVKKQWHPKRTALKQSRLRKQGVTGRANAAANRKMRELGILSSVTTCELHLDEECTKSLFLTPAHRHKRSWYKGDVTLLSDRAQVVGACSTCHEKIENDADLTEKMFRILRGPEAITN